MADCVAGWRRPDEGWTVIECGTPPSACECNTNTLPKSYKIRPPQSMHQGGGVETIL